MLEILVVAEHGEAKASITEALAAAFADAAVIAVADPHQLMTTLAEHDLALVVTGYRLAWADGLDVVRQVRAHDPALPVLMVTAAGSEDVAAEAFRRGVSDYLPWHQLDRLGRAAQRALQASAPLSLSHAVTAPPEEHPQEVCISSVIEATRAILRERDFEGAARLVLETCKEITGATAGYVGLLTPARGVLEVLCFDDDPYSCALTQDAAARELQMRVCSTHEEAYRQRKAVYANGPGEVPWWGPASRLPGLHRILCVPLISDDDVIGFLELANSPRGFTHTDALLATLLADLAVLSMQHIRLGDSVYRWETQFSHFAQSSPGGIVLTDADGLIVEWNRAEETITGVPAARVIGVPLWDSRVFMVPPEMRENGDRDTFVEQMQRCLVEGQLPAGLEQGERTIVRTDGGQRRIRYTLFPIPMGRRYGIGSITWDITDEVETHRRVEALADALQQERDILRVTMEHTRAHLAYLDPDFNFLSLNAAYVESSGYVAEELIGRNHFDLFPDPDNRAIFERVRDTGTPFVTRAKPFLFPNQPERGVTYWDWSLTPIVSRDGSTTGLVLSLVDVTEHERTALGIASHLQQTEQLVAVAQEMLAERTLEGLFEYVVNAARRLTAANRSYGIHGHGAEDFLLVAADAGGAELIRPEISPSMRTAWEELAETSAASLVLEDEQVRESIARWQLPQLPLTDDRWMGVRLVGHFQHTCAVILVSTGEEADLAPASEAVLSQLAGLASLGLQHIEAHAETSRRVAELNATISAIADGVIIYGPAGDVVRMNDTAQRIMAYTEVTPPAVSEEAAAVGATPAALAGTPAALVDAASANGRLGTVASAGLSVSTAADYFPVSRALTGRTVPGYVTKLRNPETGEIIWVSASAAPIWGTDRRQTGAIEILTDITEIRMYQDRLETANEQLQRQAEELRHKAGELVGRNRELRLLDAVGRDLSGTLEIEKVLQRVLDAIQQVVVLGVAVIWLVDPDDPYWVVRHALSIEESDRVPDRLRVWGPEGILGPVVEAGYGRAQLTPKYRVTAMYSDTPQTVLVLPLHPRGELIGVIEIRDDQGFRFDPQVTALLTTIATWAAIAIENALLHRDAQRAAVASERSRLAGELHDAVSQLLFSAKVTAESLNRLWDVNPEAVRHGLGQLQILTEGALAEMRTLLLELRPSALIETEMDELLRQLVRAMSGRSKLAISLDVADVGRLPGDVQIALYRIAQEALNNVMKHARAANAGVTLRQQSTGVELLIWDDGRGFDLGDVSASSLGLKILRERAEEIGATLDVVSVIDEGTKISVCWCGAAGESMQDRQEAWG